MTPKVEPLSYRHRNLFFYLLVFIFVAALPFLFLYAAGYRLNFLQTSLISTGGLYVAAERTGAEIYINDELVRETRVFRRAFYAQGLEARTHRILVQKEDHHTWVKELPVYPHLVTEAQAFNLPLVPTLRVVAPYQTPAGVAVLTSTSTVLQVSKPQNQILIEKRAATSTMVINPEYDDLLRYFEKPLKDEREVSLSKEVPLATDTSSTTIATTTKTTSDVVLFESDGKVFARYTGTYNSMPYYYCADSFPPYVPTTAASSTARANLANIAEAREMFEDELMLDVQTPKEDIACDPVIEVDTFDEEISYFDFFPGSTDLVVVSGQSGIYVVEIDDRAWQNRQPLLLGEGLRAIVQNGAIYIYDGKVIYQVIVAQNWF